MKILIIAILLAGYSVSASAQTKTKNEIVGTWISDTFLGLTSYRFNKDGTFEETEMSETGKEGAKDGGAYLVEENICGVADQNQNKSWGNMMLYQGISHCCYRAKIISDILVMSSVNQVAGCLHKTLKRQK